MPDALAASAARPDLPPEPCLGLEEASAADPRDWPVAAAFAILRAWRDDGRPLAFVATAAWRRERGALSARGLQQLGIAPGRIVLVRADKEPEALWALEEALKSGAVCGGGRDHRGRAVRGQPAARLRRAQRRGDPACCCASAPGGDLSAARRRWRIAARPSAPHPFRRPRARRPGPARRADAPPRRPTGAWDLEQDHETHRLGLAAGLADHGLVPGGRPAVAA
ncbi:MAG: hypothetical protein WDM92_12245 [Caulobacteraceae bacterium]